MILRRIFALSIIILLFSSADSYSKVVDKVVAYVDDEAITLSELEEAYANSIKMSPDITKNEVLNTLVNRFLLLRDARKLRLEAKDDDALITEYIELKVKAFIKSNEADIGRFYDENREKFSGRDFDDVRDDIEAYLDEREVNERLKDHIEGLRAKARIRILL